VEQTEDDTFNMLRRTPFNELLDMLYNKGFLSTTEPECEIMIINNGWDPVVFRKRLYEMTNQDAQVADDLDLLVIRKVTV